MNLHSRLQKGLEEGMWPTLDTRIIVCPWRIKFFEPMANLCI